MEDNHCSAAGRATPGPKAILAVGSCAVPVRGPQVDSQATTNPPSTVPIAMANSPNQKPRPNRMARVPVKTPVMLTCGANHTVNSRPGVP